MSNRSETLAKLHAVLMTVTGSYGRGGSKPERTAPTANTLHGNNRPNTSVTHTTESKTQEL